VTIALTTTRTATTWRQTGAGAGSGAGLRQAVRAEWTKLRTLRSTWWTLAATIAGTALVTYLAAHSSLGHPRGWYQGFDPTNQALAGLFFASLTVGVFGALVVTGEYGTGTMRSSVTALPRRGTLLAAKAIVVGVATLVVGEFLAFVSFFEGQAVFSGGAPTASLGQPGVLRAVVLSGAFLALLALFALGIGTAVRHTAGALAAYAGCVLLVTIMFQRLSHDIARFAPENIFAGSVAAVVPQPNELAAPIGFLVMGLYAAVALGIGAAVLVRRDA
jgi:ABC-type transport system involved in multi-copper enzyme maturation permease subunit